jgi:PAS domain S-box-containing protein
MTYRTSAPATPAERQVWPEAPAIQVRSADDLLEHAVSMAGLGAFDVDWRSATALVTPRLRELFGWTLEQTLTIQDLGVRIHPSDRARVFALVGLPDDSDGAPVFTIDFRIVLPDGDIRWITASAQRFFEGEGPARRRTRTVGVVLDATQRHEAEARLRDSQDIVEQAIRTAGLGVFQMNRPGEPMEASPRLREIYGWGPDEPVGVAEILARTHPDDRARVVAAIGRPDALADPQSALEHRVVHPDGTVRWVIVRARRTFDGAEGDLRRVRTVGTVLDVTEMRRAEEQRRASEERLEQAVRTAGLGVFEIDWRQGTLHVSPRLRDIYGWNADQAVTMEDVVATVHPDDRPGVIDVIAGPRAEIDESFEMEHRATRTDGTGIRILSRARRLFDVVDGQRRRVRTVGAVLDVTELREAEAQLRASEERYTLFERGVNDGIWDWNILTGEHYHSPRWLQIAGAREDEAPPTDASFFERIHPEDQQRVRQALDRHWDAGERYDVEVRLRQSDGSYRWVLSRGEAVRDPVTGRPTRMVGALTDISERKEAEEALRRAHAELEQRVQDRTRELRDLSASLLTAQEDERRRLARELHDGVTQQLALVSIDVGTIAAGDVPESVKARLQALQAKVVSISHEVRRVSHGLHPALIEDLGLCAALEAWCDEHQQGHQTPLRFTGDGGDAGLDILAASALYRVAQESVANASKHARATRVDVTVRRVPTAIELVIEDDGVGFEPGPRRVAGGMGLVSMAERMRLVNGTLRVTSSPGAGTTVVAAIPIGARA